MTPENAPYVTVGIIVALLAISSPAWLWGLHWIMRWMGGRRKERVVHLSAPSTSSSSSTPASEQQIFVRGAEPAGVGTTQPTPTPQPVVQQQQREAEESQHSLSPDQFLKGEGFDLSWLATNRPANYLDVLLGMWMHALVLSMNRPEEEYVGIISRGYMVDRNKYFTNAEYKYFAELLKRAGLVSEKGHLLDGRGRLNREAFEQLAKELTLVVERIEEQMEKDAHTLVVVGEASKGKAAG